MSELKNIFAIFDRRTGHWDSATRMRAFSALCLADDWFDTETMDELIALTRQHSGQGLRLIVDLFHAISANEHVFFGDDGEEDVDEDGGEDE